MPIRKLLLSGSAPTDFTPCRRRRACARARAANTVKTVLGSEARCEESSLATQQASKLTRIAAGGPHVSLPAFHSRRRRCLSRRCSLRGPARRDRLHFGASREHMDVRAAAGSHRQRRQAAVRARRAWRERRAVLAPGRHASGRPHRVRRIARARAGDGRDESAERARRPARRAGLRRVHVLRRRRLGDRRRRPRRLPSNYELGGRGATIGRAQHFR